MFLKCENMQKVGAFKFRGACNAVFTIESRSITGVTTHSSDNHAQAIALARMRGIPAYIVMPDNASESKSYSSRLRWHDHICEPTLEARKVPKSR